MNRTGNSERKYELDTQTYIAFVLGYDLLQMELTESCLTTDTAYIRCMEMAEYFLTSEYNDTTRSIYECLQDFVNDKQYDDLNN